jgi:hypothetical protein
VGRALAHKLIALLDHADITIISLFCEPVINISGICRSSATADDAALLHHDVCALPATRSAFL